ncbi:hypothetical protein K435DRAFT_773274 [Dendrothele bispora CBS 962.96]|uniref:Nucleoside 2-deoxyribosyltransferase like n=1 Tax=Dendrothele bispora (strain CBS 962.96) TaxID=1314807 RepID=A0A4S8MT02_DENBC|nr:hypothetical protein K435DRAFT_773274 [Dendrothele bispora CBS 962.96]
MKSTTTVNATVTVCKPPQQPIIPDKSIFLAGSIEMGKAEDWQAKLTSTLSNLDLAYHLELTVLNPRRESWDPSWVQDISNPQFRGQVEWELDCQDRADVIAMYLHPDTKAPISLLELGLLAKSGKMVVCCPEGFYRRGNVQIVCKRYGISLVESMDELVQEVVKKLGESPAPQDTRTHMNGISFLPTETLCLQKTGRFSHRSSLLIFWSLLNITVCIFAIF